MEMLTHTKSSRTENGNGHPYYIPKATSTGQSATTGVGVNLGAVTGALGVGGVLGTLAGGVNIGSSNTNLISTTTYSQRVVSIPPTASLSLEPQSIFYVQRLPKTALVDELRIVSYVLSSQCEFLLEKGIIKKKSNCYQMLKYIPQAKIKRGAIMDVPKKDNTSIAIHITYSFSENIASTQTMRSSFYLSQIVGDSSSKPDKYGYNTPDMIQSPKSLLCFRITQPGGILYK